MSEAKNRLAELYQRMTREEEERKRAVKAALLKPHVDALERMKVDINDLAQIARWQAEAQMTAKGKRLAVAQKGGEGRAAKQAPGLKRLVDRLFDGGVTTAPKLKKLAKQGLHGLRLSGGFLLLADKQGKPLPGEKLSWETVKDRLKARRFEAREKTRRK
jgi:hypothetical protein